MRATRLLIGSLTVGVVLLGLVPAARAQDDALEVGVGYAGGHVSGGGDGEGFPFGFSLQVAKDIKSDQRKKVGVFGNFLWKHHGETDFSDNLSSFLVGGRISGTSADPVTPFGKVMLGFSRDSFSEDVANISDSESAFVFGAGGGIRKAINKKTSVDGEIAILRHFYTSGLTEIQFTVMVIFLNLGR